MNITNQKLFAGASWDWIEDLPDYPSPDFTLKIFLKLRNNETIQLTGAAEDGKHKFTRSTSQTNIPHGTYSFQAQAFQDDEMQLVEVGSVSILPNLAVAEDSREYWVLVADEAKEAYKKLAGQIASKITLSNGKTIEFADRSELLKVIHKAEIKAGLKKSRQKILIKFV